MNVALPEIEGRILSRAVCSSAKPQRDPLSQDDIARPRARAGRESARRRSRAQAWARCARTSEEANGSVA